MKKEHQDTGWWPGMPKFWQEYQVPMPPHSISGDLYWPEGDEIGHCGSQTAVSLADDPEAMRPVVITTGADLGEAGFAVALSVQAALELSVALNNAVATSLHELGSRLREANEP